MGIGSTVPDATLHLGSGSDASNSGGGYLINGSINSYNMVLDQNEILARLNGNSSVLHIQSEGGHTRIGQNGGSLSIGTTNLDSKVNIAGEDYQLQLRNSIGSLNDWYIGASNDGWSSGGDQLIFSAGSSGNAVFRLNDVQENTGTSAPVAITSTNGTQRILMDGNEIDCTTGPLHINGNTEEETYLNPNGGRVGVGTSNPGATFHISGTTTEAPLKITQPGATWSIFPAGLNGNLSFHTGVGLKASIGSVDGNYYQISDRQMKTNIEPIPNVLDKIDQLGVYSYNFKNANSGDKDLGIIAQELKEVFPELVIQNEELHAVAYGPLVVVALKGIQELNDENEKLRKEMDELKALIYQGNFKK